MKRFLHILWLCLFSLFIVACFHDHDDGIGWVTITQPTTASTYTTDNDTIVIYLAGDVFTSPEARTRERTVCNCVGWECLFYMDYVTCTTETYYDSAVTITVTNETNGYRSEFTAPGSYWSSDMLLVPGRNVINVRAEDTQGNSGVDQIVIYSVDTTPPTVLSTSPDNASLAPIISTISATFSEIMNSSTITTSSFTVNNGVANISGSITFNDAETQAMFSPSTLLSYNTTYTVTLTSAIRDVAGNSLTTTSWNFTTLSFLACAPQNVQASASDQQVVISWDALPDADSYNIYFGNSPDLTVANGTSINGITATSYTHTGLTNGETYYYMVTAVNTNGETVASSIASALVGVEIWPFGLSQSDGSYAIAVDAAGNSYITGTNGYDVLIAKYDASGNRLWLTDFGVTGPYDSGLGIAVDSSGNSYITGITGGDIAGTGYLGETDAFVAKHDASGNQLWIKQFGTAYREEARGIAIDSNGNSYIIGHTAGDLAGSGNAGEQDIFMTKYDSDGNQLWMKQLGTTAIDTGYGIAADVNNDIYITGGSAGDLAGTGSAGGFDLYIAKYDSSGNQIRMTQFGSTGDESGYGIAVDSNQNTYITGGTSSDLAGTGYAGGNRDVFTVKYDSFGNQLWIKQFGSTRQDLGLGIAVDANENSYITGRTDGDLPGNVNAGSIIIGTDRTDDIFITKYDALGNQLFLSQFGTGGLDSGQGIAVDASQNAYITGSTLNTVDIGVDIFIARLYP